MDYFWISLPFLLFYTFFNSFFTLFYPFLPFFTLLFLFFFLPFLLLFHLFLNFFSYSYFSFHLYGLTLVLTSPQFYSKFQIPSIPFQMPVSSKPITLHTLNLLSHKHRNTGPSLPPVRPFVPSSLSSHRFWAFSILKNSRWWCLRAIHARILNYISYILPPPLLLLLIYSSTYQSPLSRDGDVYIHKFSYDYNIGETNYRRHES